MITLTVESIAGRVQGTVAGDLHREITGAASYAKAGPEEIAFVAGEKQLRDLSPRAGACFIPRAAESAARKLDCDTTWIVVDDAMGAFMSVLREFRPQRARPQIGLSPQAFISPHATLDPDCNVFPGASIAAGAVIGRGCDIHPGVSIGEDCRIGEDCVLHPNVVLYPDVVLGIRVILHASVVLGADGFGYRFRNQRFEKIPQLGWVEIGDDVEIGAGATVDRGMIGPTVIGEGTKIDNLVMIGHNCELGRHNALASQVGLAGSVTTGDFVTCGGQSGIADHVHLGSHTTFAARSGVHKDMPANGTYVGIPAMEEAEAFRVVMSLPKVPDLRKQVRRMEEELAELKKLMADKAA